ncbi:helix-turn-helix domain-containing protein [Patulibacter brassicae]|uniref:Helix-turn-helix domain-containing protein n=1 Tax=Patulibacter brassicae TaxID=1705717 RepID=A0ABU4VEI8_9ACTN|nr:helix-turn-helix domain-containing protein [Patulibacter brassicae]MDX8150207.1 helix-turn-helix domain-containing protein [Patulibacter brassicae]
MLESATHPEAPVPTTLEPDCCAGAGPAVSGICVTVHRRLLELEPYLQEAERLRAILDAARPAATSAPAGSQGRVRTGENKQLIVRELAVHPGSTAAQIAARTGRKRSVLASTMSRMARHGELQRTGNGFELSR